MLSIEPGTTDWKSSQSRIFSDYFHFFSVPPFRTPVSWSSNLKKKKLNFCNVYISVLYSIFWGGCLAIFQNIYWSSSSVIMIIVELKASINILEDS